MEYHFIDRSIPKSFLKYKVIENKRFGRIERHNKMVKVCLLLCRKSKGCCHMALDNFISSGIVILPDKLNVSDVISFECQFH